MNAWRSSFLRPRNFLIEQLNIVAEVWRYMVGTIAKLQVYKSSGDRNTKKLRNIPREETRNRNEVEV